MGDPVNWFDLGAAEVAPLHAFYSELFGWKVTPIAETYSMLTNGGGIPGGIGRSGTGDPWVAFYVEVADPQAKLDKAVSLGGAVVVPVTEIPGVTFAMFSDPDGLLIGMMKAMGEDAVPPDMPPPQGAPVDWFEVIGSDAKASQAFYTELFGWTYEDATATYGMVDTGAGRGIPGGVGSSDEPGSRWATVYANVEDVEQTLARAEELGGKREYGPVDIDDHMQTGAIRDPAGSLFGVYHHAEH